MNRYYKQEINSVHDKDLEVILDGLGLLNKFKNGKLKCKFCHDTISKDNLHSFFPEAGKIKFVCDKSNCVRELYYLLRENKISL